MREASTANVENCGFTKQVENCEFVKPQMLERGAGATHSITRAGAAWTSGVGGSKKFEMSVVGARAAQVAAGIPSSGWIPTDVWDCQP